jgi:low affinity Fe/Cu permease
MNEAFNRFSADASRVLGRAWVFSLALGFILTWLVGGFFAGFGNLYQLIVNTTTTIVTFLMVFIIQNTQNRNDAAMHVKLDLLLQALGADSPEIRGLEALPDRELEAQQQRMQDRGSG